MFLYDFHNKHNYFAKHDDYLTFHHNSDKMCMLWGRNWILTYDSDEFHASWKNSYTKKTALGQGLLYCCRCRRWIFLLSISADPPPSLLTVILAVVLYGLEISSLTLSEECRLTVFKNRVLKKIWAWEGQGIRGMGKTT